MNRVRDRVNQLRNRYNLEKRKVDLQKADGYSSARSTWPLFEHLRFLDGHIRPRKSYKALGRRPKPVGRPRRNIVFDDDSYIMYNERYANPIALQQQQQQLQKQQLENEEHQPLRIKPEPDLHKNDSNDGNNYNNSEYDS